MQYEVELKLTCYVDLDTGDAEAARKVARYKVANGPCLFVAEGVDRNVGHYLVKGMSAEVVSAKPFIGNRRVTKAKEEEEDS